MTANQRGDEWIIEELVGSNSELDPETDARVRARLTASAAETDTLDVSYWTVDSPVGSLLLAATPQGLVRVAFEREGHDSVLACLATQVSPRILRAPERLDTIIRQLDEYFTHQRRQFEIPIDLQLAHGFRRTVLTTLRDVAYGTTTTYAGIAAASGHPTAARAAGSACANNPLPLVVPCHRVVRGDGTIGGYIGGNSAKQILLALEAS